MRVYFLLGKNCNLLWQMLYTIGEFFMFVNGQIMKTKKPSGHAGRMMLKSFGGNSSI